MKPTLVTCTHLIAAVVMIGSVAKPAQATTTSRVAAVVNRKAGTRLYVDGAQAARLHRGMSVWISQRGAAGRGGLPIVEATVLFVHQNEAVIALPADAPDIPARAFVEPRYVAEARLYGQNARRLTQRTPATRPTSSEPPFRVWHTKPSNVQWNGRLWLEIVTTPNVSDVELQWRLGGSGPFRQVKMTRAQDGMWTADLALGKTAPTVRTLQYYIVGKLENAGKKREHTSLKGHPGAPLRISITSVPTRSRTKMVEHEPPGRVSHKQPLILTAQVNPRFSNPVLYFRARGGGSFDALPMKRVTPDVFRAEIPGNKVVVPGLSYYIAVVDDKGIRRDGFANRRYPRNIKVTRGRILSGESRRNYLSVHATTVNYGPEGDNYQNVGVRFDRRFFGFLVARLGGEMWTGMAPRNVTNAAGEVEGLQSKPLDLYLGNAGLETHLGNYFSLYFDTVLGIHNEGAALGYEAGARIGDEAGANLTLSRRAVDDLDTDAELIRRLRASLSAPIGDRLRIAGAVIHEDIGQDASRGLRLQVEASYRLGNRLTVSGHGGLAGRDADQVSGTAGLGFGVLF